MAVYVLHFVISTELQYFKGIPEFMYIIFLCHLLSGAK